MTEQEILNSYRRGDWKVVARRPEVKTVMVENPEDPAQKIPRDVPTDNTIWGIISPTGQYDEVVVKVKPTEPYKPGEIWTTGPQFDPIKGPAEEIKPPAAESTEAASPELAKQRAAEAAAANALAQQRAAEDAQRTKNKADIGYGITDKERADLAQTATSQNLTQQQVDLRARELEQSGTQRGRELDIAQANNQIAAANQALAAKRLELDQIVRDDASKLDWAKFEYLKAKDASDAQVASARLDLERLAQQQTAAAQTAANVLGQQTLEQRKAEAQQTAQTAAQTAATTAASTILTNERQAQQQAAQTGAGLLQQRAATAQGMLGQVLGLAGQGQPSGRYGGGLQSVPAGLGAELVGGIAGYSADLMGGQGTLDAATRMVQSMGNDVSSPAAATAIGVLTQMLDRYKSMSGNDHPIVTAKPNPAPVAAAAGTAAGATAGAAQNVAQQVPASIAPTAFTAPGTSGIYPSVTAAPMGVGFMSPPMPTPQAAPTVVMNF
jgi:hypothetical protein